MEYYNSFHSITEFIRQGQGRLLVDAQRRHNAERDAAKGKKKGKKSRILQLIQLAEQHQLPVEEHKPQELQGLLELSHYRGYILAIDRQADSERQAKAGNVAEVLQRRPDLVLLLDGVLDVGNLGAIVRSADLFEVGAVFVPQRRAGRLPRDAQNQLGRASCGANAWVPLIEGNLAQAAQQLQKAGYWLYGADMRGELASRMEFQAPCALLLGAEDQGISSQLRQACDFRVRIPTAGHIDSLNVSAAGAVLLYEVRRQWSRGY